MPQLRHRGKFVYGWSIVRKDNTLYFPPQVLNEYSLEEECDIILFTSSKTSGGFCITKLTTLKSSKLSKIIENNPDLESEDEIGQIIQFKGKSYCHLKLTKQRSLLLTDKILNHFKVKNGNQLLIVRGSNIAFDCLLKGPLIEVANKSNKVIQVY
ncbi:hypothetical protein PIROE2DRAFT_60224 [Piromyces sp. E2]|nr:hypothetical protein PIROE2DRAFT_60224 [Piromyces sp. E2]|eukprot:OUM65113.1 hypothetical protein PIROE2DRAFT_60224 [Piromyces sp. E2]